jgi:hypothetical protein
MVRTKFVAGLAVLCVLALSAPAQARIERQDRSDETLVNSRDVSVIVGSTLREPGPETDPSAPLFNNAGVGLGLTWGQWQAAGGSSTARVRDGGGETTVRLNLTGLVPGGVYSVFWGTLDPDSEHPDCPGVERSLPLTSVKGTRQVPDPSSFVARTGGRATYEGRAPGNILAAGQTFFWVIYQSDGEADHPFPNRGEKLTAGSEAGCRSSFGEDAMRQLTILMRS